MCFYFLSWFASARGLARTWGYAIFWRNNITLGDSLVVSTAYSITLNITLRLLCNTVVH